MVVVAVSSAGASVVAVSSAVASVVAVAVSSTGAVVGVVASARGSVVALESAAAIYSLQWLWLAWDPPTAHLSTEGVFVARSLQWLWLACEPPIAHLSLLDFDELLLLLLWLFLAFLPTGASTRAALSQPSSMIEPVLGFGSHLSKRS